MDYLAHTTRYMRVFYLKHLTDIFNPLFILNTQRKRGLTMTGFFETLKTKDVKLIEDFIVSNNLKDDDIYIDAVANIFHFTLIVKAFKSYEVAKMLTRYFDINKRDEYGKTFLFEAVRMGNVEAVKFVVSNGGDVSIKDNKGRIAADLIKLMDLQNASSMSRVLLSAAS